MEPKDTNWGARENESAVAVAERVAEEVLAELEARLSDDPEVAG